MSRSKRPARRSATGILSTRLVAATTIMRLHPVANAVDADDDEIRSSMVANIAATDCIDNKASHSSMNTIVAGAKDLGVPNDWSVATMPMVEEGVEDANTAAVWNSSAMAFDAEACPTAEP